VSVALVASGIVGLYYTFQESKLALLTLQREKAAAAASRIDAYVQEIEHQLGWMRLPQIGGASLEQRRVDYLKLLRQVPAITDVSFLDANGREQLRVSRLGMDVAGSQADLSQDPKFTGTKGGATYFSAVYFRKETEPYMTIAVRGAGDAGGVTVAEVNLKFIWDVISRIKIGEKGLAYAVDSRGQLIAHPDISQVLQKSDMSSLPQVQAAREAKGGEDSQVAIARNLKGEEVLTAFASITPLGWHVFVEQPLAEAFAPLYASLVRTGLLLLAGLMTRAIAVPFIVEMVVAILSTKISLFLGTSPLPLPPAPPTVGAWAVLHEVRSDWAQILTTTFPFAAGPGPLSLDAWLARRWSAARTRVNAPALALNPFGTNTAVETASDDFRSRARV